MKEVADAMDKQAENLDFKRQTFFRMVAENLRGIAKESVKFTTVDTYAKYLYMTDRKAFETLKVALSTYFTVEQLWYERLDPRYLVWLTTIMSKGLMPDNVKILSWNYDYQVQLASSQFSVEQVNFMDKVTKRSG